MCQNVNFITRMLSVKYQSVMRQETPSLDGVALI